MDTIQSILNAMMREALSRAPPRSRSRSSASTSTSGFTGLLNIGQSAFMLLGACGWASPSGTACRSSSASCSASGGVRLRADPRRTDPEAAR